MLALVGIWLISYTSNLDSDFKPRLKKMDFTQETVLVYILKAILKHNSFGIITALILVLDLF